MIRQIGQVKNGIKQKGRFLFAGMTCPPDIGPGFVLKFYLKEGVGYGQETL
ncbi:MAG: hypothetical protein JSV96_19265 [Candidatus Aminicenantes bacterium]|nr:MAG: hypothetical protein JSV96_19265 [Candidatus Aminicenantes bacterium]